jgi:putative addiction module component (TIGR02574 family)
MSTLLEKALKLPIAERIRLADDLYESVNGSPGSVRLTDAQLAELVRRIEDYEKDPSGNSSWEEVRDAALAR